MIDYKWVRPDMDLYHIGGNNEYLITVANSGNLLFGRRSSRKARYSKT